MAPDPPLPDYAPLLSAFHAGFAVELEAIVNTLPLEPGQKILEIACGDGTYTPFLARRAGGAGLVVGLDLSPQFLALARQQADRTSREGSGASPTRLVAASIEHIPFGPGSFDVVWCAQSLFSLPDPLDTVTRMVAMVRPGGLVAVLEDDTLHQVLLPWPIDVELAVRAAEWRALRRHVPNPAKFYVGRRLVPLFAEAGLVDLRVRTFTADRMAPLDSASRTFLAEYLDQLRRHVAPAMEAAARLDLERWIDPGSADYLLDSPTLTATVVDHLIWGRKP